MVDTSVAPALATTPFVVRSTTSDGSVICRLNGGIDTAAVTALRHALVHILLRERPHRLVLDLRDVDWVDATGLGTLLAGLDVANDRNIWLTIHHPPPDVDRQLRAAGLSADHIVCN